MYIELEGFLKALFFYIKFYFIERSFFILNMNIKVLDFHKEIESSSVNPFETSAVSPTFYILVMKDGKVRELVLKLTGTYFYGTVTDLEKFDVKAFKNYNVIMDYLVGKEGSRVRQAWGLTEKEYRGLLLGLYKVLINRYSSYNWFEKALLKLFGYIKFYLGKKG